NLISHLLDASKMQSGTLELQPARFDVIELYNDVIKGVQFTNPGYDISFASHQQHIYITADRERLEQVIINLLGNAVKYSPENKTIEVAVTIENGEIVSRISDRGIGISAEDKEKIFNRFFRAGGIAATYSGSGIGLYISEQIINRHNGKIWVESEINNGSSFYFSMPGVSE
ncbi:MAG: HAMP domain-containing sensor histidine kinase, partial [Ginsengibacter sp.]